MSVVCYAKRHPSICFLASLSTAYSSSFSYGDLSFVLHHDSFQSVDFDDTLMCGSLFQIVVVYISFAHFNRLTYSSWSRNYNEVFFFLNIRRHNSLPAVMYHASEPNHILRLVLTIQQCYQTKIASVTRCYPHFISNPLSLCCLKNTVEVLKIVHNFKPTLMCYMILIWSATV